MKMHLFIFIAFALALETVCSDKSCVDVSDPKPVKAYYGWPISFECYTFAIDCGLDGGFYQCNMTGKDANQTADLLSGSYEYDYYNEEDLSYEVQNVTVETFSEIAISIQNDAECCSQTLQLQKVHWPTTTCEDFQEQSPSQPSPGTKGESRFLKCELPHTSDEPRPLQMSDYSVQWYYNCEANLPDGIVVGGDDKLNIASFEPFKHPGIYTCSVDNNGETRYIYDYKLCAKPERTKVQISLICSTDRLRYNVGDTATIRCNVNVGSSSSDPLFHNMNFYPLLDNGLRDVSRDNISCTTFLETDDRIASAPTSLDVRVSCSYKSVNKFDEICFLHIPSEDEWESEKNKTLQTLSMTYSIKNLRSTDFGKYEAFVSYNTRTNNDTDVVEIYMDTGERRKASLIGGALGGTVIFVILLGCVLYYFRLHLRLLWKRSRFVPYEKSLLKYGAYFAYSWSNDDGETYGDLISGMRHFIKNLGFTIYDPAETPAQCQWGIQNTQEVQQNCHRVIVILTRNFLKQSTAEQDLYENFLDKEFILIKTPEFDAAFRNLSEQRRNGLNAHFQKNFTIKWSGDGGELSKKFQMQLELAMPKKANLQADELQTRILENRV